jgi:hypothetical protein
MRLIPGPLVPGYGRKPSYTGGAANEPLSYPCASCKVENEVSASDMERASWDCKEALGQDLWALASEHFGFNTVVGKAQDGGRPAVVRRVCGACGHELLVYAGVRESSNSWFVITLLGASVLVA